MVIHFEALEAGYIEATQTAKNYFPTVRKNVAKAADFVRNDHLINLLRYRIYQIMLVS
jgi:hypothetical protein